MQQKTYDVLMHSMKILNLDLNDQRGKDRAVEALITVNKLRISGLTDGGITYFEWLKKPNLGAIDKINLMLKFIDLEIINMAIRTHLTWDGETHSCEK